MKIALLCLLKYFFQFRSLPLSQHKTTRKTETKIKGKNLSHIKSSYNLEKKWLTYHTFSCFNSHIYILSFQPVKQKSWRLKTSFQTLNICSHLSKLKVVLKVRRFELGAEKSNQVESVESMSSKSKSSKKKFPPKKCWRNLLDRFLTLKFNFQERYKEKEMNQFKHPTMYKAILYNSNISWFYTAEQSNQMFIILIKRKVYVFWSVY